MPRGKPFAKGFDPRRHFLTRLDCQKGYQAAPSRIRARIRGLYRGGRFKKPTHNPDNWVPPDQAS